MVLIRLVGRIVGTEALIILIIVVIGLAPRPAVTLDTEVVITPHGQLTPAGTTLKHTLCQLLVEILLVRLVPFDLSKRRNRHEKCYRDKKLLHLFTILCAKVVIIPELFVFSRNIRIFAQNYRKIWNNWS